MKTVRMRHRAILRPAVLTLCAAMFSGTALADESEVQTHERVGLISGIVLGAVVGGPPGAVIGAIGGGLSGRSYDREQVLGRKEAEIERLRAELEQAEARAAMRDQTPASAPVATVASAAPVALNLWHPRGALETSVQFRTGSAELEAHFIRQLRHLATFTSELPRAVVHLAGYADVRGDAPANLKLSSARVRAVREALISGGLPNGRVTFEAFGESHPLYAASDREGRGFERRVLIRIATEEPQS